MDTMTTRTVCRLARLPGACLALLAAPLAQAQLLPETPVELPSARSGEYSVIFSSQLSGSPFDQGERLVLNISRNGDLCLAGRELSDPFEREGTPAEAIWVDERQDFEFAMLASPPQNLRINVTGVQGLPLFGQFSGSRTGDARDCGDDAGGEDPLEDELTEAEREILDLAERLYPALFSGGGALASAQGFIYRFYAGSRTYIGFRDGSVYVLGGPFGNTPSSRGTVTDTLAFLRGVEEERDAVAGDYDLFVSGSRTVSLGNATSTPAAFALEFKNVAAPDPASSESVQTAIERTLMGISEITELAIELEEKGEQDFVLHLTFSGVQKGIDVHYDVVYDYRL